MPGAQEVTVGQGSPDIAAFGERLRTGSGAHIIYTSRCSAWNPSGQRNYAIN